MNRIGCWVGSYNIFQMVIMKEIMCDISYSNMRTMLKDCLNDVQKRAVSSCYLGISSGFSSLDDLIGGFESGKVYVIGGRPCIGKMEFMLSMIRNMTLQNKVPVLLFSTKYSKSDYIYRLLSIHCGIQTTHLQKGVMEAHEWERVDERVNALIDASLFIHDTMDLPLNELVENARNCIREKGIRIIFIDCLQMIDFTKEGECPSEKITKAMLALKQLACLTDTPIVVGSMLNRGIEYREGIEGKRPLLMDLAYSSFIEEMADVVMMVHRPEYYNIYQDDCGRDMHGLMEICIKKNALKPLGNILLDYQWESGIVSLPRGVSESANLKDSQMDNEAVKNLIKTFELEEELPF